MHGLHHAHLRQRGMVASPAEGSMLVRWLDKAIFAVGALGPLSTFPQIWKIYWYGNAAGVSVWSWSLYAFFDIFWIVYGIVHRERPITFTYMLWFILNSAVALGAVVYGG